VPEVQPNLEPAITVCVPTIGRTSTLRTTLESLKAQSYSNYEVLLLDNASPPDTQEEISRYVRTEPRASVLRSTVRLPMFDNFQRGVDAASGRYLSFFHDDDVYSADFLTEQVHLLEANPSTGFVGSNWKVIDADGNPVGNRNLIRTTEVWSGWRYIEALFALGSNLLPMPGLVFRRDVLDSETFESAHGAHFSDFIILMRIAEEHDVGLIARQLITLRTHRDQASLQLDIGESLRLRTATFTEYCDDLATRRPERGSYVNRLRRSIRSARRSSAIWTWLQANDIHAAVASRAALGSEGMDRWLRYGLQVTDRLGVGGLLRTRRMQRRIKNAAYFVVTRTR
jgi:glycosyltransferase involved in cell wall biosynthesis